jgi:hypothetical protein
VRDRGARASPAEPMKKMPRRAAALASCLLLSALACCRGGDAPPGRATQHELARTVIERVRRNFDYRDFKFRLNITRTFPNGARYAKTFQFYGDLGDARSRVFAESVSGPAAESTRYLLVFEDQQLVSAKMSSPSMGEAETREGEDDLNKITFGNLSYPEFRHMISLRPEGLDAASEEAGSFVLRSHVAEQPAGEAELEASRASRFVYHIDPQSYLPARIEFFNPREKFKEFSLEEKEEIKGRWVVRRAKVKDFIDQSETLLEFEDVRIDEGVDESVFTEQRLRARD